MWHFLLHLELTTAVNQKLGYISGATTTTALMEVASDVVQQWKPLLIITSIPHVHRFESAVLVLLQVPANIPGKAAEYRSNTWAPVPILETDRFQSSWFQHGPIPAVAAIREVNQ